jgi:protein arginine kinase activator
MEANPVPGAAMGREAKPVIDPQLQCPHCGYQLAVFRQTGRLGCTRCYEAFRKALEPVVVGIHGPVLHMEETAKTTSMADNVPTASSDKPEVEQIREKIKDAIQNERYEEAARLRDEIKKIEGK